MSDDNVIPFPFKKRADGDMPRPPVKKAKGEYIGFCSPHIFEIDEDRRLVECERCHRFFDAFEALVDLAREWEHYDYTHRSVRHEIADFTKERDALKQQITNLKAQRRKLLPNVRVPIQRVQQYLFKAQNEKADRARAALLMQAGLHLDNVQKIIDVFGVEEAPR